MYRCPQCDTELSTATAACPRCGAAPATAPTEALASTQPWPPPSGGEPTAPARADEMLRPGALLLDRYRLLAPLGTGGMGTVYRAEDQVLGQQVALKFVAPQLSENRQAIEVLVNEVRTARRVTHANVCRVHDLGEVGGRTFISMELVEGENLSSLLRRIGRPSAEKCAQIARQLCAGLHAAHERGVLHRDLKPANVMLDANGDVRITDFGIAAAVETLRDEDATPGTPAYMAPELFGGATASARSDVYSLGLVLFELYTGRPLFRASSMTELLRAHRQPPIPPSHVVAEIDDRVEQIILRCLAANPQERPRSAMAVLAALPGGDPLAAALASGETPSPELIAQAGGSGVLTMRGAVAMVVTTILGVLLAVALEADVKLIARSPLPLSGPVLADRAARILEQLGYADDGGSVAWGFEIDRAYVDAIEAHSPTGDTWQERLSRARPAVMDFWLRRAPPDQRLEANNIKGRVQPDDPPLTRPGEVRLRLDGEGRLRALQAVPAAIADRPTIEGTGATRNTDPGAPVDAGPLFTAVGLDPNRFEEVEPALLPRTYADRRRAWRGVYPEHPQLAVRLEAAFLAGRPVSLRIVEQRWPDRSDTTGETIPPTTRSWRFLLRVALLVAIAALAWHAMRRRRGDLRGARRLGATMVVTVVLFTVLGGDSGGHWSGIGNLLVKGLIHGVVVGAELALFYFALEPHVRRRWPETMISWSRLLTGRWRDPLVGQHVLLGAVLGTAVLLVEYLHSLVPRWLGTIEPRPLLVHPTGVDALAGPWASASAFLEIAVDATRQGMTFFAALVLAKLLLKKPLLVFAANVAVWTAVWSASAMQGAPHDLLRHAIHVAVIAAVITALAIRAGLLPLIVGFIIVTLLGSFPLQLGGSWYAGATLLPVAALAIALGTAARSATRAV